MQAVLPDPAVVADMTTHNFELGRRHYSWQTLEHRLTGLLSECLGVNLTA